jgi:hypothetical protein
MWKNSTHPFGQARFTGFASTLRQKKLSRALLHTLLHHHIGKFPFQFNTVHLTVCPLHTRKLQLFNTAHTIMLLQQLLVHIRK